MRRPTEQECLEKIELKIKQMENKKRQFEARINHSKRKERTRRLITVGAIFEKHFEISSIPEAEKLATGLRAIVKENREKLLKDDIVNTKEKQEKV